MADTTTTPRGDASSDEIRRDIRRTRTDMDETVNALTDRLSPGSILDEVWTRFRTGDSLTSVVRDHPVPLALMGLGLGWLAIEQARGPSPRGRSDATNGVGPGTHARAAGRRGPYRGDAVDSATAADAESDGSSAGEKISDAASSAGEKISDAASSAGEMVSDAVSTAKDRAMDGASAMKERAGDAASSMGGSARSGFFDLMRDQPLAMGALAFGLGLAGGLSIPSTNPEDELMGRTSETLKDEARRVGEKTAHKAGRVASATAAATMDEVERQTEERDVEGPAREGLGQLRETAGDVADEVSDAAKEVAATARETARESADEEGLDAESLKADADTAARRTGEQALKDARRATGGTAGADSRADSGVDEHRSHP